MPQFDKPKRDVQRVFLHCSASDATTFDDGRGGQHPFEGLHMVAEIRKWHVEDRDWSDVGYHFLIDRNGDVFKGRDIERTPAAQKGHNGGTIAIMVHGLSSFSPASLAAVHDLCSEIHDSYAGAVTFHGHCEVSSKSCPVFDYKELLQLDDSGRMPEN